MYNKLIKLNRGVDMKKFSKLYVMMFLLFSVISFASFAASDPDLDRLEDVYNEVIVNGNKDFLSGFSSDELAIIRNTIYAKRGYKFKRKEYQKYFGAKGWYKGTTNKQNILNKNEQKLVDIIVKYEKNNENSSIYITTTNETLDIDSGSPTTEEINVISEADSNTAPYINLD